MKLHNDKDEFRAAVIAAANNLSLPEHVVEKDYWVTKTLFNLSKYEFKEYVVFKGGTSLSKGYKLINRFSEDVDLALHPEGVGDGKIHRRTGDAIHRVIKNIKDQLFADVKEGKESEGNRYKRVYSFPKNFNYPEDSPIHEKIVLEVNSFTTPFPVEEIEITSMISEHLLATQGEDVVKELDMMPFVVKALSPERTFCEKLLALRRANHKGGEFFEQRIRHVYDVHQLYESPRIQKWLSNENSLQNLLQICHDDDELNQRITKEIAKDFKSFLIFSKPADEINKVKVAYEQLIDITFDDSIPAIEDVAKSLLNINAKLEKFSFKESPEK